MTGKRRPTLSDLRLQERALERLRKSVSNRDRTRAAYDRAQGEWLTAVRHAASKGVTRREIAEVSGVTHGRVQQIVTGD